MRRVLSVWLPTFSTDLVQRRLARRPASGLPGEGRDDRRRSYAHAQPPAIILTRTVASRELVARRCGVCASAGVNEGMDLAHARTLLPSHTRVLVEPHRPDRDATALHGLACRALRLSPLAAPDPRDGLFIDLTGTERLHRTEGGEGRLLRSVAGQMRRLGFAVRAATASTFGCAWAAARFMGVDLATVAAGREREAIERLPVACLRLDEASVLGLAEIGITQAGHLINVPRSSLASRFDPLVLKRLLQALGDIGETIDPVRASPPARADLPFDGPTDQWDSVEAAARRVLDELVAQLSALERGVRRLDVRLARPHAQPTLAQIDLSRPSRSVRHLWSLLRSRLEHIDLGEGVEGVTLTATRTVRLRHEQLTSRILGADDERWASAAWGELVDTLATRLGADSVVRAEAVESHLPEFAFEERSVMTGRPRGPGAGVKLADRPTTLFSPPECAEVMALTPDGPVLSLGWRGQRWDVATSTGPERIGQQWWRWQPPPEPDLGRGPHGIAAPPDRDYFVVQLVCGRRLWMFRHAGTTRWFVHGEWC